MKKNIFKETAWMPPFALLCALLWALAYPFIKLGYAELGIASGDLGGKVLFAGIRFLAAGLLVLLLAKGRDKTPLSPSTWGWLLLFAGVNTSLHYLFSYVGLGYIPSARGTIIDSMSSFFLILLSCLLFADDTLSPAKALGCVLGFLGIVILNVEPGKALFADVSFLGDGMILLNAMSGAWGSILSRVVSRRMDMTRATGLSMAIGGGGLCVVGLAIGPDQVWNLSPLGLGLMGALILISAVSFTIFNTLLAYHPISRVAIFNAFIPVFGVVFAMLILGEPFRWKYLLAGLLVAAGIVTVNRK